MKIAHLTMLDRGPGRAPRAARQQATRLGRIVAAVTSEPAGASIATDQRCAEQACDGALWASLDAGTVHWWCPHCGSHGHIVGWRGGRWERAAGLAAR